VVVNAEPASYDMALQRDMGALRDRHDARRRAMACARPGRHRLARAARRRPVGATSGARCRHLARVHLMADGRPLAHHVQAWAEQHERALEQRQALDHRGAGGRPGTGPGRRAPSASSTGRPASSSFEVGAGCAPGAALDQRAGQPRLRRPAVSEAGGGYTWASTAG
jgi:cyclic beta-1,2-glucan synthetase